MSAQRQYATIEIIQIIMNAIFTSSNNVDMFGNKHVSQDDVRSFNDMWVRRNVDQDVIRKFLRSVASQSENEHLINDVQKLNVPWKDMAFHMLKKRDGLLFFSALRDNGLLSDSGYGYIVSASAQSEPKTQINRKVNEFVYVKAGMDKNPNKLKKALGLMFVELLCMLVHIVIISVSGSPILMGTVGVLIAFLHIKIFFYLTKLYYATNYFNYRTGLCAAMLVLPYVYYVMIM